MIILSTDGGLRLKTTTTKRVFAATALLAGVALVATACGDSGTTTLAPGATTSPTTVPPATTSVAPATTSGPATTSTPAPTTTAPPTTTVPETTTTTAPAPTTTTLPGEPFDFGPAAGDVLAVVGVAFDDVLNVRDVPAGSIVTTLDPMADDVVATGRGRLLPSSAWWEVTAGGITGWASASFLGYLGDVRDTTSRIVDLSGGIPEAETMLELGRLVAELEASEDPPSRIVVSAQPAGGDLGEVIYDVVGLGDDALLGLRLHVFGTPSESGDGFSLKSVEETAICGRGVTTDGLCT